MWPFTKKALDNNPPELVLPSIEGTPLVAFPQRVIQPIRRLISRLDRKAEIPERLTVAAALRGEGVSYISWAFATTLAFDLETTVCLVDLNWWWPSELFLGNHASRGLAAVLSGDVPLDCAVVQTGKPNLAYLPGGRFPVEARASLARSSILRNTILELSSHYDHLILDVPAVLASNDAIPLASLGTACCLVIHQGVTTITEVKSTLSDLDHLPVLGAVLNKYRFDMPRYLQKFASPQ